jgi:hypothetical protein
MHYQCTVVGTKRNDRHQHESLCIITDMTLAGAAGDDGERKRV